MRWATAAALVVCVGCRAPGVSASGDSGSVDGVEWVPPDQRGPYGVGLRTLEWVDERGKALTVDVWYPAVVRPNAELARYEPFELTISAVRDAPPKVGAAPYPLAAFSHGFAAIRYQSAFLMEHLASHGWVLVAPDHNGNTFFDIDPDATPTVVVERPGDIRNAVDGLVSWADARDDDWVGLFDADRYAMIGHSFGALTSLVVGGGSVDLSGIPSRCEEGSVSGQVCDYVSGIDPERLVGTEQSDPRARVIVPLSPGIWYGFGRDGEGLSTAVPSLLLAGTLDTVLEYESEARPTFMSLAPPSTLATFAGAGHYVFSDICLIAPFFSPECDGGDGWIDLAAAQQTTKTLVTAWLDETFLGTDRSRPWLSVEGLGAEGYLTIETRAQ